MYFTLGWITASDNVNDYQAATGSGNVDLLTQFSKPSTPFVTKARECNTHISCCYRGVA
jgi:hypothetical protein